MTKETKIGLLVGLAFIILFAIILSEKGPVQRGAGAPQFTIVDSSSRNSPPSTQGQPLHNAGKLPVDTQLAPIVKSGTKTLPAAPLREEQVAQAPTEDEPLQPLPDSLASLIKSRTETPAHTAEPVGPSITKPEPSSTPGPILARIPEPKPFTEEPAGLAANETKEEPTTTTPPVPADDGPKIIWTVLAEHTVQPGESLGKIAAKYYGRSTPARVDALFKMNKDTMPSVSSVKAGHKLRIPNLGEHADKFEPGSPFAGSFANNVKPAGSPDSPVRIPEPIVESTPKTTAKEKSPTIITASKKEPPAEIKFELYEIRKGDTLSKIARKELGSEKYAKDLQRLNKIGEKQNLKPGTKIRLPVRQTAQGESTTLSARAPESAEP
ncbi:MAG: LysM peptidoglycan-binding domain-containing protein [Planctomycetes bacterium]|nr:LysM peptidoglycan-binding domain-containing protein [Planctomycetota bacterium]